MNNIEAKYFIGIAKDVLNSFNFLPTNEKELKTIDDKLGDLCNCLFTYNMWSNENHISSSFTHQTKKSRKKIMAYLNTQITHLEASMELCLYQFSNLNAYFHLYTLKVFFQFYINNENNLIDKLHEAKFKSLTEPDYYEKPFVLLENVFGSNPFHFDSLIKSLNFEEPKVSEYKNEFAYKIISMYKFFDSFNMTAQRLQTNFSIAIYNSFKSLNLSKDKTKLVADTIINSLDIKAAVNLDKIDKIHYIGTIFVTNIYSYEKPTVYTKFLDRNLIQKIQQEKKELALKNNNSKEVEILNKMIQSTNSSFTL